MIRALRNNAIGGRRGDGGWNPAGETFFLGEQTRFHGFTGRAVGDKRDASVGKSAHPVSLERETVDANRIGVGHS